MLVFNKADLTPEAERLALSHPGAVAISAVTGAGTDELLARIADRLRAHLATAVLDVPYARGDVLAAVHRGGEVLTEESGDSGVRITARLTDEALSRFAEFRVAEGTT